MWIGDEYFTAVLRIATSGFAEILENMAATVGSTISRINSMSIDNEFYDLGSYKFC
jgi:hypothetical protein